MTFIFKFTEGLRAVNFFSRRRSNDGIWMDFQVLIFTISICILFSSEMNKIIASDQTSNNNSSNKFQTYIVHVQMPTNKISTNDISGKDLETYYQSFLPTTTATTLTKNQDFLSPRIVYPYHNIFKGFSAKLTPLQVKAMAKKEGFVSAEPQKVFTLHTTHSPHFLGLRRQNTGFWHKSNYGKGVIIGLLDTGIQPDHHSFSDEGMPPPPAKWKGICEFNNARTCNNKLIGARYFGDGNGTPMDEQGHGTHTAGTAAGNFVNNAAVFGQANGTASGVAPLSHIAMYNVCPAGACSESSMLAAMDTAIQDGVDVLSISLGGKEPRHLYSDNLAIGAFSAMERGIFVSCAAGNLGPDFGTLSNIAPWMLTVGASTINRRIRATAILGNGEQLHGESAFQPKSFRSTQRSLVFLRRSPSSQYCTSSSLRFLDLRGKVVLCLSDGVSNVEKGKAVKNAGGVAMILMNQPIDANSTSVDDQHVLPTTHLSYADGLKIIKYISSRSNPTGTIVFKGTVIGDSHSPVVASFSSRGPNLVSLGILKPDILGPGVNILAAYPFSVDNNRNTKLNFNFLSGTSMACPHLSGVVALLKSAHPHWSPAAIKSAIMTTADVVNLAGHPIEDETFHPANVFAVGAGHVHPARASNPGLIYDLRSNDYIPYLCGLNYTSQQVSIIVQRNVNCTAESRIVDSQLNYPSFSVELGFTTARYSRMVTNVGEANSSYIVEIGQPTGVFVKVEPRILRFSAINQALTYEVTFSRSGVNENADFSEGYLKWTSTKHSVRSPIAIIFV